MTSRIQKFFVLLPLLSLHGQTVLFSEMVPFVLPWNDATENITNVSHWSEKPAGKNGYLYANESGELMSGSARIRLWGVNLTAGACFPSNVDADQIAARMSKFGINVVRFHHMNAPWAGNDTLINYSLGNSRSLNPATAAKLGYLINALKENGIYTNLNLLVSRQFYGTDGFPSEIGQIGWKESHSIGYFNDHHLELQKEFASQLLNYVNPYSGIALKDDPAVAVVEILNENSLFKAWFSGDLDTWPAVFQQQITPYWNDWLTRKFASTQDLKDAWGFVEEPLGDDLLTNGDLRLGTTQGWYLEQHSGATASMSILNNVYEGKRALRVNVNQVGTESWHIQPKYTPVELVSGQMYTVRFAVRGSAGQSLSTTISQDYSPWGAVDFQHQVQLTADWQPFEISFIASKSDNQLRIIFNGFAKIIGYVDIADLSMRTGGTVGSLPDGTSLEGGNIPWLRLADNNAAAPEEMMRDWLRFIMEREKIYVAEMEQFLRETIGYNGLIIGTQMGYAPAEALVNFSAADTHAYWQHPNFPGSGWDPYNWYINNESMVNSAPGTIGGLAKRRVKGLPHFVSEYQHAFPNTYSTEAPVLIGAYAALQNWDGIYFFNYGNTSDDWSRGFFDQYFDVSQHPGNMANLLLGAALFRREDVIPANQVYAYPSPTERFYDGMVGNPNGGWVSGLNEFPFDEKNALLHRLEIDPDILNEESSEWPPTIDSNVHASDSGEIVWNQSVQQNGYVKINSAKTKALVGFTDGSSHQYDDFEFIPHTNQQNWLTLGLIAMEGDSIAADTGSRCLLIATGECSNTGMQWNLEKNSLINNNWGRSPSLVEVIPADIVIPVQHWRVRVWALDNTGERLSEIPTGSWQGKTKFSIGLPSQTLWYEVEIAPIPVIKSSIMIESDGQTETTTVSFQIDQAIPTEQVSLQESNDLQSWSSVPGNTVQWIEEVDSLKSIIQESRESTPDKYYRATILD